MSKYILEDLDVYNLSNDIADEVWQIVAGWSFLAQDTIGKQMIRSSDSIAANIAEGYGRYFFKENRQFCFYARGSILETKTWIGKAGRRNLISGERSAELITKLETVHAKLNGYMKYIGKKAVSEPVN
ncbi:MAG: four helix bundle protein [Bacteroidia bacterium]